MGSRFLILLICSAACGQILDGETPRLVEVQSGADGALYSALIEPQGERALVGVRSGRIVRVESPEQMVEDLYERIVFMMPQRFRLDPADGGLEHLDDGREVARATVEGWELPERLAPLATEALDDPVLAEVAHDRGLYFAILLSVVIDPPEDGAPRTRACLQAPDTLVQYTSTRLDSTRVAFRCVALTAEGWTALELQADYDPTGLPVAVTVRCAHAAEKAELEGAGRHESRTLTLRWPDRGTVHEGRWQPPGSTLSVPILEAWQVVPDAFWVTLELRHRASGGALRFGARSLRGDAEEVRAKLERRLGYVPDVTSIALAVWDVGAHGAVFRSFVANGDQVLELFVLDGAGGVETVSFRFPGEDEALWNEIRALLRQVRRGE